MNGLHLIADLYDCRCLPAFLLDRAALEALALAACERHGLHVVGKHFHQFADANGNASGVTGAVILAESHLALHTWPELGSTTLDVYVCNYGQDNSPRAEALFTELIAYFAPLRVERQRLLRGQPEAAAASRQVEAEAGLPGIARQKIGHRQAPGA